MAERVRAMLIGRNVFVALALLTALEYWVAVSLSSAIAMLLLLLIAFAKAWLIVIYFMHIGQLRRGET